MRCVVGGLEIDALMCEDRRGGVWDADGISGIWGQEGAGIKGERPPFRGLGETGVGRRESEGVGLEIHVGNFSFHLPLHEPRDGQVKKSSHGVGPGHLLQDGDEEAGQLE